MSDDPMAAIQEMAAPGTNTLELGGRFVKQDYKGDPTPDPTPFPNFAGQGYWGFNKHTQKYEGFWIDSASTVMQNEAGTVDESGKVWTRTGEIVGPDGEATTKRSVITLVDDDHHHMEMFFTKGDQEFMGMDIQYTRA